MGLIETCMAWFWAEWRIKQWFTINGLEHIIKAYNNKSILLIGLHVFTLELGARYFGILNLGIGVYRPNKNLLLDWFQTKGRLKSNKSMFYYSNVKGMICALKNKEKGYGIYTTDHDYGPKSSVFVPLFAVFNVATIVGKLHIG